MAAALQVAPPEATEGECSSYHALDPSSLADQIVYAINQPWRVWIGDMTVRASRDAHVI